MKRFSALCLALLLGLSLAACGGQDAQQTDKTDEATQQTDAQDSQDNQDNQDAQAESQDEQDEQSLGLLNSFTTTDLDGNEVDQSVLADYQLNMVNVWGTFCTPCINEMPHLGELSQEYAEKGVQILGLVIDVQNVDGSVSEEQLATARDIVQATGANYTHLLPSADLIHVTSAISSVPMTFFVDSDGSLVGNVYLGAKDKDAWTEIIDQTLAEVQA